MTNEEKSTQVAIDFSSVFPSANSTTVHDLVLAMAEWKDAQFKFLLESEIERMKLDYPDTSTIQIRRYLEGLVEKLFKEN